MSLVELPDFSFGLTLYEAVNLMILPGLEAFVHYFIRDIILRPFVLPESVTIPLMVRPQPPLPPCAQLLYEQHQTQNKHTMSVQETLPNTRAPCSKEDIQYQVNHSTKSRT